MNYFYDFYAFLENSNSRLIIYFYLWNTITFKSVNCCVNWSGFLPVSRRIFVKLGPFLLWFYVAPSWLRSRLKNNIVQSCFNFFLLVGWALSVWTIYLYFVLAVSFQNARFSFFPAGNIVTVIVFYVSQCFLILSIC